MNCRSTDTEDAHAHGGAGSLIWQLFLPFLPFLRFFSEICLSFLLPVPSKPAKILSPFSTSIFSLLLFPCCRE